MKKAARWVIVILCLFFAFVGGGNGYWERPVKYAVREENFDQYANYILVREVHYTGTGWTIVGDENGFLETGEIHDIELLGEELPRAKMPEKYNTFLCIVERTGIVKHEAFLEEIDSYQIKEWYPVYPVVRNRLGADIFGCKRYMTQKDMEWY